MLVHQMGPCSMARVPKVAKRRSRVLCRKSKARCVRLRWKEMVMPKHPVNRARTAKTANKVHVGGNRKSPNMANKWTVIKVKHLGKKVNFGE